MINIKQTGQRLKFLCPIILCVVFVYCLVFNYTNINQLGICRNVLTGRVYAQETSGFHLSLPWVLVIRVDTRPIRVAVMSSGRVANSKLVQFEAKEWASFVETEGWRYYWWSNRISFNMGYKEEYRGWRDVMRGYGYSAKKYPFIKVLEELKENN